MLNRVVGRVVAAVVMVAFAAAPAHAQTKWYIHATQGNDNNTGADPRFPMRTLNRWREQVFDQGTMQNGDELVLSGVFRESLLLSFDTDPPRAANCTVRGWRANENPAGFPLSRPQIRGDRPLTGWQRAGQTNRFRAPLQFIYPVSVVWNWDTNIDNKGRHRGHLRRVNSATECEQTPYSWYYDSQELSVNLTTPQSSGPVNPATGVLSYIVYGGNGGMTLQKPSGWTVSGLDSFMWLNPFTGTYGLSMEHATNCRFVDCRTADTSHHGIGYTGFTGPGNSMDSCVVSGLLGLDVDPNGDCFGFLSSGTDIYGSVRNCTAVCYSLLMPDGRALNPGRNIHGLRAGTSATPQTLKDFVVDGLTVYSYYPECGQFSTPVRLADCEPPTDRFDPATYPVKVRNMKVVKGGYQALSGSRCNVLFQNCTLDFSQQANRGLYLAGAINVLGGPGNSSVMFDGCTITGSADNPNGIGWPGLLVGVKGGVSLLFNNSVLRDTSLRWNGSTTSMFFWFENAGSVYCRGTRFQFGSAFGVRRLCTNDAMIMPPSRDFDGCSYIGLSEGNSYTNWYGPAYGFLDIRSREGWIESGEEAGDPNAAEVRDAWMIVPGRGVPDGGGNRHDAVPIP